MPLNARRFIRKMRGGAQAHLIEADDNRHYIVKFVDNPQHRRILVNEWIASVFLRYLRLPTPEVAIVNLSEDFLRANPEVHIQLGTRRQDVRPGWHFGSCFPGDPGTLAVYDFLPDVLLRQLANLRHFLAALVFDKWMANADSRQAIYFRARLRDWGAATEDHPSSRVGFVAVFIDQGYVFNGPHWEFADSPLQGLFFRPLAYEGVNGLDDFQPWLDQVMHFPETVVDQAVRQVPPQWLDGDEAVLEQLLERLMRRRSRVPDLLEDCKKGRTNPFPNWI